MSIDLKFFPILVHDPLAAVGFYRDALGFEVRNDVENGGHHWITLGSPGSDAEIVLADPYAGRSEADGEALAELIVKGVIGPFVFRTDDVDAAFQRAKDAGAEVLEEPKDQPWGPRDCALRDPSGNVVRVSA